jgi:hypothetical protein
VLAPRQHQVRGYIAASSWGRTWYERMLDKAPSVVNTAVKAFIRNDARLSHR